MNRTDVVRPMSLCVCVCSQPNRRGVTPEVWRKCQYLIPVLIL
jgi:hypothetical protein